MALEPGLLSDLEGAAQQEWDEYVAGELRDAINASGTRQLVADGDPDLAEGVAVIDWSGFPKRIRECLQSDLKTDALTDWVFNGLPVGRCLGSHEEYLEWRVVRNANNKIVRVEMTSEVQEYWITLARHHPRKLLRLMGRFAGEGEAPWQEVYLGANPFQTGPDEREEAFRRGNILSTNLPPGPYNNGQKAISFMTKPVNTLRAAIFLAAFAAHPYGREQEGEQVPLTGREAIRHTRQSAQDCRDSDPTIVGGVIDQAWRGKKIALLDPAGLYIADVNHEEILLPDESESIPAEWFEFQRGARPNSDGSGLEMSQRLVFEVPQDAGFVVGDLIHANSGRKIEFGAQIARLVTIALYARASHSDIVNVEPILTEIGAIPPCSQEPDCAGPRDLYQQFEELQQTAIGTPLAESNLRGDV